MRHRLATISLTALLLGCGMTVAFPLFWMVYRSFHHDLNPLLSLDNYTRLFAQTAISRWLANSLFVVSLQTLIACFAATLAGYVLAHHQFPTRRPLLGLLFAALLLPGAVTLPAAWRLLRDLHLLNTYWALLLPSAANVFGALLFYQAARQVPPELLDAARIDGCSEWRVWWEIVLPVIQPTLVTFAVVSFTANWNAYLWPQIILQDESRYTLAMGLANLATMPQQRDLGLMLAATTLSIVPAFALFLASRSALEESLTEGSGK